MKLLGDVPEHHRDLADALERAEKDVDEDKLLPKSRKAQIYTCLAHDWYDISVEEEGNRLLLKAEATFPGYFKDIVVQHMLEDENFQLVIGNITSELIQIMVGRLNEKLK